MKYIALIFIYADLEFLIEKFELKVILKIHLQQK